MTDTYDSDTLTPAFLTEQQAAALLNITKHELYLRRRRGDGPPFVMHGARVRYPDPELREWAQALPRFSSLAEAYAANPERAVTASRQRKTSAKARAARWPKSDVVEADRGGHPTR